MRQGRGGNQLTVSKQATAVGDSPTGDLKEMVWNKLQVPPGGQRSWDISLPPPVGYWLRAAPL